MPQDNHEAGKNAPSQAEGIERRAAPRYECNLQTTGHVLGPKGGNAWVATITNISATGIALLHRGRIKPGTVLVITLQSNNHKLSRPMPVRVMHATAKENDQWLLGCAFVRKMNEEDLQTLI
ncbi:MAG: PilZ domain-containing protein [Gemmataceae bacterium]